MNNSKVDSVKSFERKQVIFTALGLVLLMGLSVIFNSIYLDGVAKESTRFISRLLQMQEFRQASLALSDAKLGNFLEVHYVSTNSSKSFNLPPERQLQTHPGFWRSITTEQIRSKANNPLDTTQANYIIYVYNRFRLLPYALLIWLLMVLFTFPQTRMMKRKVAERYEKELESQHDRVAAELAKEVRHNLRSPLAALMRIPSRLPDSYASDRELLTNTIDQIKSLVAKLGPSEPIMQASSNEIYHTLSQSVREIRLRIPFNIDFQSDIEDVIASALISHVPHEMRSLLENVVDNSIDAISGEGEIRLTAQDLGSEIAITISDTGHGIPENIRHEVFREGFSFGKPNGSGVGLTHAKKWVEIWSGTIEVNSDVGTGTTIRITLPIEDRKRWYVPRIKIEPHQKVIVVDDQASARGLWSLRLEDAGISNFVLASSPHEFRTAVNKENSGETVYLIDYDLKATESGLDLLKNLPVSPNKYLVTGHFDELKLQRICAENAIHLIPKGQMPSVPIIVG